MWTYEQLTGKLLSPAGILAAIGYSGAPAAKNDPAMQDVKDVGPIPCGKYSVDGPFDTKDHGPFVLRLTPDPGNQMFGRSGFLMHGDSLAYPGTASEGCIIMPRTARELVMESADRELQVVSGEKAISA